MKFSISVLALLGAFFSCPWSWWVVSTMQKFNQVVHHRVWNLSLIFIFFFVSTDAAGEVHQNKDMFHCMREGMMKGPSMWIFGGNGLDIYSADGSDHLKWLPQHHWVSSKVCFHLSMMRVYSRLMQYLIESYTSYIYTQVPWRWLVFILQLLQCCIRWKEVCLGCRFSRCSKDWCVRHRYGCHSWFLWDL